MKLKGHTIIDLTDPKTGRTERIERDNLVTNAAAEILTELGEFTGLNNVYWNENYAYDRLALNLFGGLLLLDTAQTADEATLFPTKDTGVTGSGKYNTQNGGVNTHRGSCNTAESSLDWENGVLKFVYDFTTSQGNGIIASVCLTSTDGAAYTEDTAEGEAIAYPAATNFGLAGGDTGQYANAERNEFDGRYGLLLEWDTDKAEALYAKLDYSAKTLTFTRIPLYLKKLDLFSPVKTDTRTPLGEITVDLSSIVKSSSKNYNRISYDHEKHRVYVVADSGNVAANGTLNVLEVNPDNGENTAYTVTNATGQTIRGDLQDYYSSGSWGPYYLGSALNGTVYEGWLYLVSTDNELFRISLANLSNVVDCGAVQFDTSYSNIYAINAIRNGRFYWKNRVFNTQTLEWGYNECGEVAYSSRRFEELDATANIRTAPVMPKGILNVNRYARTISIQPNYLATICNLGSPVEKTNDKTMKVTYILQRTEDADEEE